MRTGKKRSSSVYLDTTWVYYTKQLQVEVARGRDALFMLCFSHLMSITGATLLKALPTWGDLPRPT